MTAALAAPASAGADHWDKFSCYAYVHDQCYGGGQNNCSGDDYNWGLDQCDGYYPNTATVKRLKAPGGLTLYGNNRQVRSILSHSFRK